MPNSTIVKIRCYNFAKERRQLVSSSFMRPKHVRE